MRPAVIWLLVATATISLAEIVEEPWVEEEDLEEPYNEYPQEDIQDRRRRDTYSEDASYDNRDEYYESTIPHERKRREAYVEQPYEEHVRVKRRCYYEPVRVRRSAENARVPRQVHQYEVHEFTDENTGPISPPYEEMLAASAEHYHRVYAAPGAPASAKYLNPDVSGALPIPLGVFRPVTSHEITPFVASASANVAPVNVSPINVASKDTNAPVKVIPAPVYSAPLNVAPVPLSVPSPDPAQIPVAGPLPVASVPVAQLKRLAGDQYVAAAGHHHNHAHGHAHGGGHQGHGHHYGDHGGKSSRGYKHDHHVDKGNKGYKTDELHRKEYEEAAGQKKKHHDHAGHKGSHEEEAHGQRGSHFDEKKGHKKGHKTKGYHNKYHKDEFHKEHKFYDDFHKSGEHHRYGKFNAKHASNESGKKKAHHVNAGHDVVERGKKGYSNKGHLDSDHKGYKGNDGHEEHHNHHTEHGKKGGKEGGSHWGYSKKN